MGWYEGDPYGNLGRLQAEAFRAARLVVDTGIHAQGWTFDQAEAFLSKTSATSGATTSTPSIEIARYIVWPGQSTAYKIGMIKILELRQRAMDQLGERFDLKEFHTRGVEQRHHAAGNLWSGWWTTISPPNWLRERVVGAGQTAAAPPLMAGLAGHVVFVLGAARSCLPQASRSSRHPLPNGLRVLAQNLPIPQQPAAGAHHAAQIAGVAPQEQLVGGVMRGQRAWAGRRR